MRDFTIAGRSIGPDFPPFVIAELSANHNGDINRALAIMDAAKACGADAVKLQTYTQDTLTIDCDRDDFIVKGGLWDGRTLYDLYKEAHMPWDWQKQLFDHARALDLLVFSTPFDSTAVDFLEDLNAPAYKIASFEAIDLGLIKTVASTGKPMIISTGMANLQEIEEAIDTALSANCKDLAILHCVSAYPAEASDYNLRTLHDMGQRFGLVTGLSDHTIGNTTAITSIGLGAAIVEKHFTLDRLGGGPDDSFSLEPPELKQLCEGLRIAWQSLGAVDYDRKPGEKDNVTFRRSLYFVKDLKAGDKVRPEDVRSIRPGFGLAPKYLEKVIGSELNRDVCRGSRVTWGCLDECL